MSLWQTLERESESAIDWFKNNSMMTNPDKFQTITFSKNPIDVTRNKNLRNEIETTKSVKFLGVEFDYQIKFNEYISKLCYNTAMQQNPLYRLQKHMSKTEKNIITNNFICSNFNYYPLVWHFCSCQSSKKIESIQKHIQKRFLKQSIISIRVSRKTYLP